MVLKENHWIPKTTEYIIWETWTSVEIPKHLVDVGMNLNPLAALDMFILLHFSHLWKTLNCNACCRGLCSVYVKSGKLFKWEWIINISIMCLVLSTTQRYSVCHGRTKDFFLFIIAALNLVNCILSLQGVFFFVLQSSIYLCVTYLAHFIKKSQVRVIRMIKTHISL